MYVCLVKRMTGNINVVISKEWMEKRYEKKVKIQIFIPLFYGLLKCMNFL